MPRRPTFRRSASATFALTLATTGLACIFSAQPAGAHDDTRVVRPGQSIQAAIDAARPGQRIVVRAGTYAEQLTITKNGITLAGAGAVLVPPAAPVTNTCSGLAGPGTEAGICVTGRDVQLAPFVFEHRKVVVVGRRVRDVTVKDFEVRGFSGANIALVGATDTHLESNRLDDGDTYGALSAGSEETRISRNTVTPATLGFIGICVDDVTPAVVSRNDVSGFIVGLCIQTQGADIRDNESHDNCVGIFVDPGIGAYVHDNHISTNNAPCGAIGFFTGIGVLLQGTSGTEVRDNRIEGHTPGDFGAALVIIDADAPGPVASGNVVRHNRFDDNTLDIQVASAGTGNVIERNRCTTSDPAGLCSQQSNRHGHGHHSWGRHAD